MHLVKCLEHYPLDVPCTKMHPNVLPSQIIRVTYRTVLHFKVQARVQLREHISYATSIMHVLCTHMN